MVRIYVRLMTYMKIYELDKSTGELIWTYNFTLPICFGDDNDVEL